MNPLFLAALAAGASYTADHWLQPPDPWGWLWKGSGVALLAMWAAGRARSADGWLIAAALALGALGDVLLDTQGLVVGAVAFLAGHLVATALYLRHRTRWFWRMPCVAVAVALTSWLLSGGDAGVALYALGLGAMAGAAWASRFPPLVWIGALLFVISDLLIFARMGVLAGSPLPGLLIWPTYFGGQALIAWGVVTSLSKERGA